MSDETEDQETTPSPVTSARSTTPAGAAASRARRIGGRAAGSARRPAAGAGADGAEPADAAGSADATGSAAKPAVVVTKAGRSRTDEPAGAAAGPEVVTAVPAWLRWAPAGVLGVGALTMAILLVVFSHGVWWGQASAAMAREKTLAAAKTCVARTNTYKYTDLPAAEKSALACTTGTFTGQLRQAFETIVEKNAPLLKASQTTQINTAAIESISPHGSQWTIVVFGQLTAVNSSTPKGETDPFSAVVRMEKVHGKWLIASLNQISSPVQN